jgi:hypothetical protein
MTNEYAKSKIYKMESPSGLVYVGSTYQPLCERKAGHKRRYRQWKNGKNTYNTSCKLFEDDPDNIEIYLIEDYPCENIEQLRAREGYYIKKMECVNKHVAGRSREEWRKDTNYNAKYYEQNKDKIKEQKKDYYQANTEAISENRKQYRQDNLEKLREYDNNRKGRGRVKFDCECSGKYCKDSRARHMRSQLHQNYLKQQEITTPDHQNNPST